MNTKFQKETSIPNFGIRQKLISNAEMLTKKGTY